MAKAITLLVALMLGILRPKPFAPPVLALDVKWRAFFLARCLRLLTSKALH